MIAFDTNHLVRHIVHDDALQAKQVAAILKQEVEAERPVHILDMVLMETAWVLQSVYGFDREALSEVFSELLEDAAFGFEYPEKLWRVLEKFRNGKADFADYLIYETARSQNLQLKTFDKKLLKELR